MIKESDVLETLLNPAMRKAINRVMEQSMIERGFDVSVLYEVSYYTHVVEGEKPGTFDVTIKTLEWDKKRKGRC